jgi:hypothetical protein
VERNGIKEMLSDFRGVMGALRAKIITNLHATPALGDKKGG